MYKRQTSGWQKSDLVIIAARPGMGKTALVLSLTRNAAITFQRPVAVFSLEMSSVQLVQRMISSETAIPSDKLRKGDLDKGEWNNLVSMTGKLSACLLYTSPSPRDRTRSRMPSSA